MRTTLTVDDRTDHMLRDLAQKQGKSYKEVVNEALLRGAMFLAENSPEGAYRVEPVSCGFVAGIDAGKLNQLADEIEVCP